MKRSLWLTVAIPVLALPAIALGTQVGARGAGANNLQLVVASDPIPVANHKCIKCGRCPNGLLHCCATYCFYGDCPAGYTHLDTCN